MHKCMYLMCVYMYTISFHTYMHMEKFSASDR